jgi:dihydroxy-acid dehydratase
MKSELITKDVLRAPQRGLLRAVGCIPEDFDKPFIGVINSYSEIVADTCIYGLLPNLQRWGVRSRGGVPSRSTPSLSAMPWALGNNDEIQLAKRELLQTRLR